MPEEVLYEKPTIFSYDTSYDVHRDDPSPLAIRRTRGPTIIGHIGARAPPRPKNRAPRHNDSPPPKPTSPPKLDLSHRAGKLEQMAARWEHVVENEAGHYPTPLLADGYSADEVGHLEAAEARAVEANFGHLSYHVPIEANAAHSRPQKIDDKRREVSSG